MSFSRDFPIDDRLKFEPKLHYTENLNLICFHPFFNFDPLHFHNIFQRIANWSSWSRPSMSNGGKTNLIVERSRKDIDENIQISRRFSVLESSVFRYCFATQLSSSQKHFERQPIVPKCLARPLESRRKVRTMTIMKIYVNTKG